MAKGIEAVLGDRIDDGCIIVKHGHREDLHYIRQLEAGHPIPDEAGVSATTELLRTITGLTSEDRVIVLVTGGASALMVAPVDGVTLREKASATDMLLRSGATIEEINGIRKRLSRVKGGRLLDHVGGACVLTLLISDVPGGDAGVIGSGPTIVTYDDHDRPDLFAKYGLEDRVAPSIVRCLAQDDEFRERPCGDRAIALVLADVHTLVRDIRKRAVEQGLAIGTVEARMMGDTQSAARSMVAAMRSTSRSDRPSLSVFAGETTLQVKGNGRGGRNQEFALVAAMAIAGAADMALLCAGTDGTDGPTDAAGAFADGNLVARAISSGLDPQVMLDRNDSYSLFERTGDLFQTGPTGTNVMDLILGLVW
jgi:hydroxypyruvate reductase